MYYAQGCPHRCGLSAALRWNAIAFLFLFSEIRIVEVYSCQCGSVSRKSIEVILCGKFDRVIGYSEKFRPNNNKRHSNGPAMNGGTTKRYRRVWQ